MAIEPVVNPTFSVGNTTVLAEPATASASTARELLRSKSAVAGLAILAIIVLTAVFAPFIAPFSPNHIDARNILTGPSRTHLFGTDELGRDLFSRTLFGGSQPCHRPGRHDDRDVHRLHLGSSSRRRASGRRRGVDEVCRRSHGDTAPDVCANAGFSTWGDGAVAAHCSRDIERTACREMDPRGYPKRTQARLCHSGTRLWRVQDINYLARGREATTRTRSACPDGECSAAPGRAGRTVGRAGLALGPGTLAHPVRAAGGSFPGVDDADIYEFLDQHARD